jgi:RNA polymerase sigma-70 factor (ECF subfamily)
VDDPDAPLVARAQKGDRWAFEQLVERHRAMVYRVAARIVGPGDAEDVSQDTFLRAFHRLDQYRGTAPFRTWLLQITQNTALNALAWVRRRPTEPSPDAGEAPDRDPLRQPVTTLERREREERLDLKLRALRPEYRSLLVLRDLEGLSYNEIAEVLAMPLGSVKGRLHRARSELIELLRNNTYDWELPA